MKSCCSVVVVFQIRIVACMLRSFACLFPQFYQRGFLLIPLCCTSNTLLSAFISLAQRSGNITMNRFYSAMDHCKNEMVIASRTVVVACMK